MEQIKKIKVKSINSKILFGDFGNGKYFGYKNKKIISLVEIKLSNKLSGFGESLVGIYSPDLYKKNLEYLSKFFINKNVYECLEVSKNLQKNKFFFYSGLLKSILASIEIAIFNLIAKLKKKTFAEALNDYFFLGKRVLLNDISVYASAGSIRSTLRDLEKDLSLSEKLKIKNIKIRLNIKSEYKKKITILKSKNFKFAVDLISNTFEDNEILKFPKFLSFIKNFNPLWIEEVLNVDKLWDFQKLKKKHNIKYSYGENFNSKFDFYNLIKFYKFDYINVDISHITITELVEMVILLEKNNFKNKILFHCWGGVINLQTSLELASLFRDQVYMTEFPIADFSLNNDFVHNVDIVDSKVNLNSINRMNINDIHAKDKNLITKNLINKYEFNFKK
jgi:L-alanine-DL-glutamate epimerase-like enolase superfamily enzyme